MKITQEEQLREIYGEAKGRSTLKQLSALEQHSLQFISLSPFIVLSTANANGQLDASPRGGEPGFVKVLDDTTILLPDSKGNKRLDSFINILSNPQVGCLFLIPGVDETLRINGCAEICTDDSYKAHFSHLKNPPLTVLKMSIDEVFLHCAKALMRSKLWSQETQIERNVLPPMGKMINDQIKVEGKIESHEDMVKRYLPDL